MSIKIASDSTKIKVLKKFKAMKNDPNLGTSLLVEKHTTLAPNHPLNGIKLSMANKLTAFNVDLINKARNFAPSHFDYVFDSPDGTIKAKIGKDSRPEIIRCEEDIARLVADIEKNRRKPPNSTTRQSPVSLRSSQRGRGGRGGGG